MPRSAAAVVVAATLAAACDLAPDASDIGEADLARIEQLDDYSDHLGQRLATDHPLVVTPFLEAKKSLEQARHAQTNRERDRQIAEAEALLELAEHRGASL